MPYSLKKDNWGVKNSTAKGYFKLFGCDDPDEFDKLEDCSIYEELLEMECSMRPYIVFFTMALVVCSSLVFADPVSEKDVVSYIKEQAKSLRAEESVHKILWEKNSKERAAVLFTLEQENMYRQFLTVIEMKGGRRRLVLRGEVGGRGRGMAALSTFESDILKLEMSLYGLKDAECCPSLKGTVEYRIPPVGVDE